MDAREFEPDDPLPQTCQHCKWGEAHFIGGVYGINGLLDCTNPAHVSGRKPLPEKDFWKAHKGVKPDHTCKHWEERE